MFTGNDRLGRSGSEGLDPNVESMCCIDSFCFSGKTVKVIEARAVF